MIEDTKALKEEENMFNTKFNIKNNYMSNFGNPFTNNHIDASDIFNNNVSISLLLYISINCKFEKSENNK